MYTSQASVYTIVIIAGVILALLLLYFLVSVVQQQRKYQSRYAKEIESEITTLENERKRIAADLHDDLGPILSAAKMKLNSIEEPGNDNEELLNKSVLYIDNSMSRIRELAKGLMPTALLKKGVVYAMQEYIQSMDAKTHLQISFEADELNDLRNDKGIHLFRILQEIIHNTIKHARAKNLLISIHSKNDQVIITTADDGQGFAYDESLENENGLGLRNIQSRIHVLGGDVYVKSGTGKGTSYYITIPINN